MGRIFAERGDEATYSTKKLGALGSDLGAIASFFDSPWSRLSSNLSEPGQAWLLNEAAFSLRALGRLTEAREPMRVSANKCDVDCGTRNGATAAISYEQPERIGIDAW